MKYSIPVLFSLFASLAWLGAAQTNTFPSSGNVGIGTALPQVPLHIQPASAGDLFLRLSTNSAASGSQAAIDFHMTSNQSGMWGARIAAERKGASARSDLKFYTSDDTGLLKERFRITKDGFSGLGTAAPTFGDISYGGATPILHVYNAGGTGSYRPIARFHSGGDADYTGASIIINHSNDRGLILEAGRGYSDQEVAHFGLIDCLGNVNRFMSAVKGGRVGIGTESPTHELSVNGTVQAKEVIVESGWADYVFAAGYRLAPLSEVASHIEEHGRLPGVPSAAEVAEKGASVGDTQRILLEKVEELTLYMIEKDREIAELRAALALVQGEGNANP